VRAPRTHRVHPSFVPDERDADGLPRRLVPDLDPARPTLLQFGEVQHRPEITWFRTAVRVVHADPAAVNQVPTEIAADEHAGPAGGARQPSCSAASLSAQDDG
jgi:hypothetical protein